ncbi:MAG TPA: fibronectin type III domain-containing protein [Candidatus Paceibacterota bacterium]|nr:fibronectin type III domain-containing protein [Candidatus Paceibacterota bacterium]
MNAHVTHHKLFFVVGALALFFGMRAFAQDANPPQISNIQIGGLTATSAVITWDTDKPADSQINYCLTKDYGIARDPGADKTKHTVTLMELDPSTLYHLRVGSQDSSGNQALSGDYTLITKGALTLKTEQRLSPQETAHVEKVVQEIQQIQTTEALEIVQKELTKVTKQVAKPPYIMGPPRIAEIGMDYAIVAWETDDPASSIIEYSRESEYDVARPDAYSAQTEEGGMTKEHSVRIVGLVSGTNYHLRAGSKNSLNLVGYSRDVSFMTKSPIPTVQSFRVIKAEADSATLGWKTTVPAAGIVEYTDIKTKQVRSAGSPVFASTQAVKIAGLKLGARYMAVVKAENAAGEKVTSDPLYFSTVKDTTPPIISKVTNESTLYPTAEAKVQTIVSWATDEPAYCTYHYRAGLNPSVEATNFEEEKEPRTNHVEVIIEFMPSTVYQFWMTCRDPSRNASESEKFVLFTPNKEKSIIDIILENFQGAFGWVKNIGK